MRKPAAPEFEHRINFRIRIPQIMVIGSDGEQLGVMSPDQARSIAQEEGLDLVEVAPNARPPVCRIMDYGKFRYDQSKKQSASKSRSAQLKTVQMRPRTDEHDLETKKRKIRKFLESGDYVRVIMRMRGRERALTNRWQENIKELVESLSDIAKVRSGPHVEGRTMTVTLESA